jgi:hypothetical protein
VRLDSQISKRLPVRSSGWAFHTKIAVGLIVTGLLVYPDYIFDSKTLLYTEFGSDSLHIFYPFYILLSDTLILVGVLYLPFSDLQTTINRSLRVPVIIFLLAYTVLLAIGQFVRQQRIVAWTIIVLSATELIYLDRITISARHRITKEQLNERVGYNDWTFEAIQDINSLDRSFFRITKTWGSSPSHSFPSLDDAMVFGYYGTSSHSSFNNVNYTKFLIALDVMSYGEIDCRHRQLFRAPEQPARLRTNFLGGPIILQADIWFGVIIALHDRSIAAIRKRSDGNRE